MKASELIDRAANNQGLSHAKLAKMIQLTPGSLSNLRTGKGELSDDTYVKLAKLAGVDPVQVLIEKHARKAGPEAAPLWKQIQKHLPKSAAIAVIAVCAMPLIPEKAQANQSYNIACSLNKHYANLLQGIVLILTYIRKSLTATRIIQCEMKPSSLGNLGTA